MKNIYRVAPFLVLVGMLQGCSTVSSWTTRGSDKHSGQETSSYVDQQMLKSVQNIELAFNSLVLLEKGPEAVKRMNTESSDPIHNTVAQKPSPDPEVKAVSSEAPLTQLNGSHHDNTQSNDKVWSTPMSLTWTGESNSDALEFLEALSTKIGYDVYIKGTGTFPKFSIKTQRSTLREIMEMFAQQVDSAADVRLTPKDRRIEVIFK